MSLAGIWSWIQVLEKILIWPTRWQVRGTTKWLQFIPRQTHCLLYDGNICQDNSLKNHKCQLDCGADEVKSSALRWTGTFKLTHLFVYNPCRQIVGLASLAFCLACVQASEVVAGMSGSFCFAKIKRSTDRPGSFHQLPVDDKQTLQLWLIATQTDPNTIREVLTRRKLNTQPTFSNSARSDQNHQNYSAVWDLWALPYSLRQSLRGF